MKIIFVTPWTKSLFGDQKQASGYPHLGLAYLIGACKQNGYKDIRVFDQGIEKDDSVLSGMLKTYKPDLVGITSYSYCYKYAQQIVADIKDGHPQIPVIVGGPHISATKKHILETTEADFAMKNESEVSFINFLKQFESERPDYAQVKNLLWREGGKIVENASEEFIRDLDALPFPDYGAFGFERYSCYKVHLAPLITSRGCPYGCNYCSIRLSMGRNFRARSPQNVTGEIKHLMGTFGINHFEINDDCFALDIKRAEDICDKITADKLSIKYEIYNGIRADNVTERFLGKMKQSGCIFISYGCESGNQEIIDKYIGKRLDLAKVREAVELTNKAGIRNSVNFIIGHPGETYETAMDTLRFAASLKTDFVNMYNLIPYPGTELFDWISKNGKFLSPPEEYLESSGSRDLSQIFETKEFSRQERIKVLKKGYALYEKTIFRFRFGIFFGYIVYLLSRNRGIFTLGRKLAFDSGIGSRIYRFLSGKSREN